MIIARSRLATTDESAAEFASGYLPSRAQARDEGKNRPSRPRPTLG